MHVNPVTSDGNYTIGYDDDGVAGQWDGNMTETTDYFRPSNDGDEFSTGHEIWICEDDGDGEIVWVSPEGEWATAKETLAAYGAR